MRKGENHQSTITVVAATSKVCQWIVHKEVAKGEAETGHLHSLKGFLANVY